MFPHEVAALTATSHLAVDLGIHVVLMGLAPVYAHGLHTGLTAVGLDCTVLPLTLPPALPPTDEGSPTSGAGSATVLVVPSTSGAAVPADTDARVAAVHVLPDASVQAYSDALRAGATGAFPLDAELRDIVRIVLCAGAGQTLLPVDVARALNRPSVGRPPQLTDRDRQYLRLLADGATVAGISRRFALSEREMYRLLSATYRRLGARNRTEALLLAQRFDLLAEQT